MTHPDHDVFVLTVTRRSTDDDPPIHIFNSSLLYNGQEWRETHGSQELLSAYLAGLNTCLRMMRYPAGISWDIPATWYEPAGLRWTIRKGTLLEHEHLDREGRTVRI